MTGWNNEWSLKIWQDEKWMIFKDMTVWNNEWSLKIWQDEIMNDL